MSVLTFTQLTANQRRIQSILDCRIVLSVAELTVRQIFISSANKKYTECLTYLQKSLINTFHNMDQGIILEEHQTALQKVSNKCYGVGQQNKA